MTWSQNIPTEAGYYWWRSEPGATAEIVSVVTSDKFLHPSQRGTGPTSLFMEVPGQAHATPLSNCTDGDGEWLGPVQPPN